MLAVGQEPQRVDPAPWEGDAGVADVCVAVEVRPRERAEVFLAVLGPVPFEQCGEARHLRG